MVWNLLWPALWSEGEMESAKFISLGSSHPYLKKLLCDLLALSWSKFTKYWLKYLNSWVAPISLCPFPFQTDRCSPPVTSSEFLKFSVTSSLLSFFPIKTDENHKKSGFLSFLQEQFIAIDHQVPAVWSTLISIKNTRCWGNNSIFSPFSPSIFFFKSFFKCP